MKQFLELLEAKQDLDYLISESINELTVSEYTHLQEAGIIGNTFTKGKRFFTKVMGDKKNIKGLAKAVDKLKDDTLEHSNIRRYIANDALQDRDIYKNVLKSKPDPRFTIKGQMDFYKDTVNRLKKAEDELAMTSPLHHSFKDMRNYALVRGEDLKRADAGLRDNMRRSPEFTIDKANKIKNYKDNTLFNVHNKNEFTRSRLKQTKELLSTAQNKHQEALDAVKDARKLATNVAANVGIASSAVVAGAGTAAYKNKKAAEKAAAEKAAAAKAAAEKAAAVKAEAARAAAAKAAAIKAEQERIRKSTVKYKIKNALGLED